MKLASLILLSAWAAAAPAPKQPSRSSSSIRFEDGSLRILEKNPKTKNDLKKDVSKSGTEKIVAKVLERKLDGTKIVKCDHKIEETCYDDFYQAVSCALISDGGCPCPDGTERCGADLANGCVGYCTDVCCDWEKNEYHCSEAWQPNTGFCATIDEGCSCPKGQEECVKGGGFCSNACCDPDSEEHCYGPNNTSFCAKIADEGCPCPEGQKRCGAYFLGSPCVMECCDGLIDETCYEYDDGYSKPFTNQYCAAVADGGCPCQDGQVKCGADLKNYNTGWCADICCDSFTEETCYDPDYCALIADGGCPCPKGQERCGADLQNNYPGWCTDVCCDQMTEETCYNSTTSCNSDQYCASFADGGCPCPEGQEKCGADLENNYPGWCTEICCDQKTEETCYDYNLNGVSKSYCKAIADGGCPCPENQVRCGQDLECNNVGWCTDICCDQKTEETCYDFHANGTYYSFCSAIADGGCPCPEGQGRCGVDVANNYAGWCTDVCCDQKTEETCYESNFGGSSTSYCIAIADGGCPCPEGLERCGQDAENGIVGWCSDICCNASTEEPCYEIDSATGEYKNTCMAIEDGGCPCWEGTKRCGADEETGDIGFCSNICCEWDTQLLCYNEVGSPYCYNITGVEDIICPELQGGICNNNGVAEVASTVLRKLTQGVESEEPSLCSYLLHLEATAERLAASHDNSDMQDAFNRNLALKQEIENLRRIIKRRDIPTRHHMKMNRELNFWEKN